jgi:hypothetical protein
MHGRTSARIAYWLALALGTASAGCDTGVPLPTPPDPFSDTASLFDPNTVGIIQGEVTWQGEAPTVAPFQASIKHLSEPSGRRRLWDNPNAPGVDARSRGVAGAVVFLRGVDPRHGRPWDHARVRVALRDHQVVVCQDTTEGRTGFVRRGQAVEMVSEQAVFHALQARGAAFFTLAFPDADQPRQRRLSQPGLVELSSGAGHYWMRGYLFVDDHPYYTRTNAEGRFRLEQVPPGEYELVCWLPNWHEAAHERDGDTCQISRLTFCPPVEVMQPLALSPGETKTAGFTLSTGWFGR